jgi:hypothetical protein
VRYSIIKNSNPTTTLAAHLEDSGDHATVGGVRRRRGNVLRAEGGIRARHNHYLILPGGGLQEDGGNAGGGAGCHAHPGRGHALGPEAGQVGGPVLVVAHFADQEGARTQPRCHHARIRALNFEEV